MTKTSTYKIFNNLDYNVEYQKLLNFKDIEIFIKNYSSNDKELHYIHSDIFTLEKNGVDKVFVFILEGEMTVLDDNKNIYKILKANDFFELCFTNSYQKLSFYTSDKLKLFIVNNNINKNNDTENINNLRFNSDILNSKSDALNTLTRDNFNHNNILFEFFKYTSSDENRYIPGIKFETEEFFNICNYKKFKVIKAIYGENDKANLFLKESVIKKNNDSHTSLTYILSGELEIVSKETGETVDILSSGNSFTSNSFELAQDYYFVSRQNLQLLIFTTNATYVELHEAITRFHEASLKCQEKDMYTHLHNQRVGMLSMLIAKKIGLPKQRLETLRIASLFHDIGKVFTPNEILLKPGKLNDSEYEIMKEHVLHSYDMTKDFIDKDVCDVVVQHHERLNGCGYPYGLHNEDICIEAKILAIADTYDAMTSDRPYRKALSADFAIKEIINYIDIHYDRELVKAFHDILFETKEITVRYI